MKTMIETVQTTLKKEGKPCIYWKDKLQQKKIPTHFCHPVSIWEKLIITSGQMVEVVLF